MARVSDLDFGWTCVIRVLEQGIELRDRLTAWIIKSCSIHWQKRYTTGDFFVSFVNSFKQDISKIGNITPH